ncbi:SDR family oxidoreductase [Candidatus Pantoea multigeneris]|uniref:SDR family oxidoreductase n=1 Tax=Candidatus Pantoea multigeneris TaxID=2608357 RepID=A0ABX0R8W3_9GAMM|nr:SDR family oxidoreductase [Pantoea multigeneris]NIF21522.1 SDR family oxidoreductase [Pantoea multigeneris]
MLDTPYKTALVTGATSGIGKAIVEALSAAEYSVIALGRNKEKLSALSSLAGVKAIAADVTDRATISALIAEYDIDVVINNAGVLSTRASFQEIDPAEIENMLDINLKAPLQLTRDVLPQMVARKKGHIFFVGSSAGRVAHPNAAVYGASKAGISLFCDALRCDLLGTGIRVTEIAPGRVQTELYRSAISAENINSELYDGYEAIQPEDIAKLLLTALQLPKNVDVSRLEVFPTAQATGGSRMVKTLS